jgi:hypothetical protein
MPLSNWRRTRRLIKRVGMQQFGLFEPSLILSKDARFPGPCADLVIAGQPVVVRSARRNRPLRTDVTEALLGGGGPGDGGKVQGYSENLFGSRSRKQQHRISRLFGALRA